mmetsp:Transcript_98317/g.234007  ORF Transcript_98317/g.234007 Transcript_98317/m.234007 type:complete len:283 (+) Transcript_98317:336-1184(+)
MEAPHHLRPHLLLRCGRGDLPVLRHRSFEMRLGPHLQPGVHDHIRGVWRHATGLAHMGLDFRPLGPAIGLLVVFADHHHLRLCHGFVPGILQPHRHAHRGGCWRGRAPSGLRHPGGGFTQLQPRRLPAVHRVLLDDGKHLCEHHGLGHAGADRLAGLHRHGGDPHAGGLHCRVPHAPRVPPVAGGHGPRRGGGSHRAEVGQGQQEGREVSEPHKGGDPYRERQCPGLVPPQRAAVEDLCPRHRVVLLWRLLLWCGDASAAHFSASHGYDRCVWRPRDLRPAF